MVRVVIACLLFMLVSYLVWKTLIVPLYRWVRKDQAERKRRLSEVDDDICSDVLCCCDKLKKTKLSKLKPKGKPRKKK